MTSQWALRELAGDLIGRLGFAVLPLHGNKAPVTRLVPEGYVDATKNPYDLWWFDESEVEMVGIVPGSGGYLVLDVDVKRGDGKRELTDAMAAAGWTQHQGTALQGRWVDTPSGGVHIYFRKPDLTEHIGNPNFSPNVNVRCDAGYVVAPGNPGYTAAGVHWAAAPEAPEWVMDRLRKAAEAGASAALEDPYSAPEARLEPQGEWHPKVVEAFRSFDRYGDRHTSMMLAVAALCNHELLGYPGSTSALEMLEEEFAAAVADRSSPSHALGEYRRALDGARRKVRSTVSVGLEERDKDHQFIDAIVRDFGGDEADVAQVAQVLAEQRPSALKLWSMSELMESDLTLNWLVRNVLCMPTYGQIAGEKKTLKTYISQFLALAVATGSPFLRQFPVERQGNVVMFVGEGGRIPWTRRMARIAETLGISDVRDVPVHASFQAAPLLSPEFRATVEQAIEDLDPVLVVIDPLYAFHGSEVNSASLHEEGALLTTVAAPFVKHGITLLICNHFKKGVETRGLNRITGAGSGEWADTWLLTFLRGLPDLNIGDFPISMEIGSRQWGGSQWDLDFNIGTQDPMGGEPDEPITFDVRRSYA